MTLHKSMWKAAVLMGIAGVLMFAGGAGATPVAIGTQPSNQTFTYGTASQKVSVTVTGVASTGGKDSTAWFRLVGSNATGTANSSTGGTFVGGSKDDGAAARELNLSPTQPLEGGTFKYYAKIMADSVASQAVTPDLYTSIVTVTIKRVDAANLSAGFTNWETTTTGVNAKFIGSGAGDAVVIKSGDAIPNTVLIPLTAATNMAAPGSPVFTWSLDVAGATTKTWTAATETAPAPITAGTYSVAYTTIQTANYEAAVNGTGATSTSPFAFTRKLIVEAKTLPPAAINKGDSSFAFNAGGKYTINSPRLWSTDDGTADTVEISGIVHTPMGGFAALTKDTDFKLSKVTKASTYELEFSLGEGKVAAGVYTVTYIVKGKEKASPNKNWVTASLTQKLTIVPKQITDGDVSIPAGADIVYDGNDRQPGRIVVKDGTRNLAETDTTGWTNKAGLIGKLRDFTINFTVKADSTGVEAIAGMTPANRKNAGTAYVFVQGHGNYTGAAKTTFDIKKKPLTVTVSNVKDKVYDGLAAIDTVSASDITAVTKGNIKVTFDGLVTPTGGSIETLNNVRDYIIAGAKFDSVNVSDAGTVTASATVSLVAGSANPGRNYSLANGAVSKSDGIAISKRAPNNWDGTNWPYGDSLTFSYTIPTNRYFKDAIQAGINAVTFRTPIASPGATLRTVYGYKAGQVYYASATDSFVVTSAQAVTAGVGGSTDATFDTTFAPRNAGSYPVKVRVLEATTGASKNVTAGTYHLGTYTISEPAKPQNIVIVATAGGTTQTLANPMTVSERQNRYPVLTVTATSPNDGTLSYQWLRLESDQTTLSPIIGATTASFTVPTGAQNTSAVYRVRVTNRKPSEQIDGVEESQNITVSFTAPATLVTGKLEIKLASDTLTYTGFGITPSGTDLVVNYISAVSETGDSTRVPLTAGTHYTATYARNVNVGRADIIIVGKGDYDGSGTKNFQIAPKELTMFDLTYAQTRPYDGTNTGANVRLQDPKTGAGTLTVKFDGETTEPKLPGLYTIEVSATAGTNFKAAPAPGFWLGMYQITKGKLDSSSFAYTIPANHVEGAAGTVFGIGAVTFKKGEGYGTITVRYNGETTVPSKAGTYIVTAEISGGEFYDPDEAILGNYTIKTAVSVAQGSREVPKSGETNVVSVAPVKVAPSAKLTAGPSPVKQGGEITFFSKSNGSIYIFDASGSNVAKVPAKSGKAVWNLKDKKGVTVSEGTYVAVAKDGREKVSFKFSVVK